MQFGERLKSLRLEKNLNQTQLAQNLKFKVTQQAIDLWEKGKRLPRADYIVLLADYFGVSADYLLGRTDY